MAASGAVVVIRWLVEIIMTPYHERKRKLKPRLTAPILRLRGTLVIHGLYDPLRLLLQRVKVAVLPTL